MKVLGRVETVPSQPERKSRMEVAPVGLNPKSYSHTPQPNGEAVRFPFHSGCKKLISSKSIGG